jgi:hypothetical protein
MEAQSATITLTNTSMGTSSNLGIGVSGCGLMEAIASVANGANAHGCVNSGGSYGTNDTIVLIPGNYSGDYGITLSKSVNIHGTGQSGGSASTIRAKEGIYMGSTSGTSSPIVILLRNLAVAKHTSQNPNKPGIKAETTSVHSVELSLASVTVSGLNTVSAIHAQNPFALGVPGPHLYLVVDDSKVTGNGGTGIHGVGTLINMARSTVSSNLNRGFYLINSNLSPWNSTIESNTTTGSGGGVYMFSDSVGDPSGVSTIDGPFNLIANNIADSDGNGDGFGGGIYFHGRNGVDLIRATVSGNRAEKGGGLYVIRSNATYLKLRAATVAFNNAKSAGGGVYDASDVAMNFHGSIVAKNTINGNPAPSTNGTDINANIIVNCSSCFAGTRDGAVYDDGFKIMPPYGGAPIDPMFESLAYLGGFSRVHRLQLGSPAIDFQTNLDVGNNDLNRDARGLQKGSDGDLAFSESEMDLGAYESGGYTPLAGISWSRPSSMTYTQASTNDTYVEVFVRGTDNNIYGQYARAYPNGAIGPSGNYMDDWSGWYFVTDGGTPYSPSMVPYTNNEAYMFVTDSNLWVQKRNAFSSFGAWVNLGNHSTVGSGPIAVSVNNQSIYAFVRGTNNTLKYRVCQSTVDCANVANWNAWSTSLGSATVDFDPGAVYLSGTNKLYVFAWKNGAIAYQSRTPGSGSWSGWNNVDTTPMSSGPSVAARASNQIELCATDAFGALACNTLTGSTWSGWSRRPTHDVMGGGPTVSCRNDGANCDVFYTTSSGDTARQPTRW